MYDEIEDLSRKIAKATHKMGFWKAGEKPKGNLGKRPWADVLDQLLDKIDFDALRRTTCPQLSRDLIARVRGITGHRNQSGHKPKSKNELIARDTQLRTLFEAAADLLLDLINASKPLHVERVPTIQRRDIS